MDQQNHKACTRSSPQLMVENPGKWWEGPQQLTRLVQGGPPQLMVENLGKWQEGPHWFLRTTNKTAPLGATKILKKKIPITSSFIVVSCPWFLLFCFVLYHQSWGSTYTWAFKNIVVFNLKTGVNLYINRLINEKIRYMYYREWEGHSIFGFLTGTDMSGGRGGVTPKHKL